MVHATDHADLAHSPVRASTSSRCPLKHRPKTGSSIWFWKGTGYSSTVAVHGQDFEVRLRQEGDIVK